MYTGTLMFTDMTVTPAPLTPLLGSEKTTAVNQLLNY